MRLAVLSDIHGNLHALQAVLADLDAQDAVDHRWVLGDLAAFGGNPAECIQIVREIPDAKVIRGNTDRYLMTGVRPNMGRMTEENYTKTVDATRERDASFQWTLDRLAFADIEYLVKLRTELYLDVPDFGSVIAFHAIPGDDESVAILPNADPHDVRDAVMDREGHVGLCGHTHVQFEYTLPDEWRIINPGSVGFPFDSDPRAAYAILTFEGDQLTVDMRRVEYDIEAACDALAGHPSVELMTTRLRTGQRG